MHFAMDEHFEPQEARGMKIPGVTIRSVFFYRNTPTTLDVLTSEQLSSQAADRVRNTTRATQQNASLNSSFGSFPKTMSVRSTVGSSGGGVGSLERSKEEMLLSSSYLR